MVSIKKITDMACEHRMLIVLTHIDIPPLRFPITWQQKLAERQLCYWEKSNIGPILSFDAGTVTKIRWWEEVGGW